MLLTGKANAAGVKGVKYGKDAGHISKRAGAFATIVRGIGSDTRLSTVLARFGKPTFAIAKPVLKLYYCRRTNSCLVFSFGLSKMTDKMLSDGVKPHYLVSGEKIVILPIYNR